MPQPKKRILVLTADGGAARWFECARLGGPLRQVGERRMDLAPTAARDRPFRVHDRFGSGRHAVEARRSPRVAAEEAFLIDVADAVVKEEFDALVVCAPPRALGALRRRLAPEVSERIILTSAKDYLRETPVDLAMRLRELSLKARGGAGP